MTIQGTKRTKEKNDVESVDEYLVARVAKGKYKKNDRQIVHKFIAAQ